MPETQYVKLAGSERQARSRAIRVGNIDPHEQVQLTLTLNGPQMPSDKDFPREAMTREEYRQKYSTPQADIDAVTQELKRFGLTVTSVSPESRSMVVSGTLEQIQKAFPSDLGIYYHSEQGKYRGREGAIQIPAGLQKQIKAVLGLDERQVLHRRSSKSKDQTAAYKPSVTPLSGNGAGQAMIPVTPANLEERYHFPPGQATGQHVVIAEFGGGYFASDLQAYCRKFGLPEPNITVKCLNAQQNLTLAQIMKMSPEQRMAELNAAGEVMMDIEIIAGLCPQANLTIYFSTFDQQGIVAMLNDIISGTDPVPVAISISWGGAEDDPRIWSPAALQAVNERFNAVALLGVTICVSAGDDGSGDQVGDTRAHVDFPASSPFVLSVGGTMVKGGKEVVWRQGQGFRVLGKRWGATGGGVSTIFARPSWQNQIQVTDTQERILNHGRAVPDISALSTSPDYDLVFQGEESPNGGTSASAPLLAALLARIQEQRAKAGKKPQFFTPLLYISPTPGGQPLGLIGCNDITSGNNTSTPDPGFGYAAKPGFDAASGWGTPLGDKLVY